jgi:hypothetical protein
MKMNIEDDSLNLICTAADIETNARGRNKRERRKEGKLILHKVSTEKAKKMCFNLPFVLIDLHLRD